MNCYLEKFASHPSALAILFCLSVVEASVAPVPPVALLAPMIFICPQRTWLYAVVLIFGSVIGSIIGYAIGYCVVSQFGQPAVSDFYSLEEFNEFCDSFSDWGVWVIIVYGVSPAPFQVVTLSSGVMQISFVKFVILVLVVRMVRYLSVAFLLRYTRGWYRSLSISRQHRQEGVPDKFMDGQ